MTSSPSSSWITSDVPVSILLRCGFNRHFLPLGVDVISLSQALPGGHLEMYESWKDCAIREVKEETDLDLDDITFGHVTNDPMKSENKHYVTIFMFATCKDSQMLKNMEPDKCEGWNSYSWHELEIKQSEGSLFGPLDRLVKDRPSRVLEFLGLS